MIKKKVSFDEIIKKINEIDFPDVDIIVAIAHGGIVPGAIIANLLKKDFSIIYLNYRDESNNPYYNEPKLLKELDFDYKNKKILIVDDVSRTGKTLSKAKEILNSNVKTFVINGKADYSLYNCDECLQLPWN